jgi:hypothetical protein
VARFIKIGTLNGAGFVVKRTWNDHLEESEYFELQAQYEITPRPSEGYLATGEHYNLVGLLQKFGYIPQTRQEACDLAELLLTMEWKPNGYYCSQ